MRYFFGRKRRDSFLLANTTRRSFVDNTDKGLKMDMDSVVHRQRKRRLCVRERATVIKERSAPLFAVSTACCIRAPPALRPAKQRRHENSGREQQQSRVSASRCNKTEATKNNTSGSEKLKERLHGCNATSSGLPGAGLFLLCLRRPMPKPFSGSPSFE